MYYISDYTESIPILLSEWNHNFWTDDKPSPELSKLKIGTDGTFIWLITTICMWFFFFLDRFYNSTVFVYSLKKCLVLQNMRANWATFISFQSLSISSAPKMNNLALAPFWRENENLVFSDDPKQINLIFFCENSTETFLLIFKHCVHSYAMAVGGHSPIVTTPIYSFIKLLEMWSRERGWRQQQ